MKLHGSGVFGGGLRGFAEIGKVAESGNPVRGVFGGGQSLRLRHAPWLGVRRLHGRKTHHFDASATCIGLRQYRLEPSSPGCTACQATA